MTAPYPWPPGKRSAMMISIDVDADTPLLWRTRSEGQLRYLAEWEQRQHGLRAGIAAILAVLARHDVSATFFVPGLVAERNPHLLPQLAQAGHEIGLHGYAHEAVRDISDTEFTEALDRSVAVVEAQTGMRPEGFRAPGWEMTPHMLAEIARHGFYDSSLAGLDWPYTTVGITEIPVAWTREDTSRFKLTGLTDRWPPTAPQIVLEEWLFDREATSAAGGLFVLTLHDWIAGRPAPLRVLDTLLAAARTDASVWIATGRDIARHHRATAAWGAGAA